MKLELTPFLQIPFAEFEFSFSRSSGPGGQNVNKVNSKALLRWSLVSSPSLPEEIRARFLARYPHRLTQDGEILLTSDRFRDQKQNQNDCVEKLKSLLLTVVARPKTRKATKPTHSSKKKKLEKKRQHGDKKKVRQRVQFDD